MPPGPNVRIDATLPVTGEIHLQSYDPFFVGGYGDDIIPGLYSHLHDYREPSHPTFEGTIGVGGASGSIGGTPVEWAGLKWSTDNANLEWVYTG